MKHKLIEEKKIFNITKININKVKKIVADL